MKALCLALLLTVATAYTQTTPNPDGADPQPFLGIAHKPPSVPPTSPLRKPSMKN